MKEEQIRQNAETYADAFCSRDDQTGMWQECCNIFIAGAHSRDEEIKELNARILNLMCERDSIKSESEYLIDKLRNPWISVEDRLPKKGDFVFVRFIGLVGYTAMHVNDLNKEKRFLGYAGYKCTHWMPIPQIEKGE